MEMDWNMLPYVFRFSSDLDLRVWQASCTHEREM